MDNVHLEMKVLKKLDYDAKNGKLIEQSSIRKLAYNHATKLEFNNEVHNFVNKQEDDFIEDYFLKSVHTNYLTSEEMFRHLEEIEQNRNKAQLCFNLLISLDHKLDYETNKQIMNEFLEEIFISQNLSCDVAIHNKNNANLHAHVLIPLRHIDQQTGKLKNKVQSFNNQHYNTNRMRKVWAEKINKARAEKGIAEQIDYRSNAEKQAQALEAGDLVTAQKLDHKSIRKPAFRDKAYRRSRIEKAKKRKQEAAQKAEEIQRKIDREREIINEINQIEQNKKQILATANELVEDHNNYILQRGLNQSQLIEQQRQQQIRTFKF
ncbi:TPA: MobA/MobL family protein [Pasteurella multocida]|nr:MobA/MobL family protein [Pasteurella multocida]HEA3307756.1 MobA/MobL family protein [Pasteurella multocida]